MSLYNLTTLVPTNKGQKEKNTNGCYEVTYRDMYLVTHEHVHIDAHYNTLYIN